MKCKTCEAALGHSKKDSSYNFFTTEDFWQTAGYCDLNCYLTKWDIIHWNEGVILPAMITKEGANLLRMETFDLIAPLSHNTNLVAIFILLEDIPKDTTNFIPKDVSYFVLGNMDVNDPFANFRHFGEELTKKLQGVSLDSWRTAMRMA